MQEKAQRRILGAVSSAASLVQACGQAYRTGIYKREAVGNKILKGKFWLDHEELRMSGLGV